MMTLNEIRQLDTKLIVDEIKKSKKELAKYKLDLAMNKQKDTSFLRKQRVYIAKLSSVLNEKVFLNKLNSKNNAEG